MYGPLWQGRYRSKLVIDQRYLGQLLVYIHLNPVHAGIVMDNAFFVDLNKLDHSLAAAEE